MPRKPSASTGRFPRALRALAGDRAAATAVEFAFVLPPLLLFLFGIVETGRVLWTQSAISMAVEDAARCASVNQTLCGTASAIQTYAAARTWGLTIPASDFAITTPACGFQVVATVPFSSVLQAYIPYSFNLTATACFPKWQ